MTTKPSEHRPRFATFTTEEKTAIKKIWKRYACRYYTIKRGETYGDFKMDISACHAEIPLNLPALADATMSNLIHDVVGINQNLNRKTCKMDNCFVPRYARPEATP